MIFDSLKWQSQAGTLSLQYQKASPFPHIVLDNFLAENVLKEAVLHFPNQDSERWMHYTHLNEVKLAQPNRTFIPFQLLRIIDELNGEKFVNFLCTLTGISGLFPDPALQGGGLHAIGRSGYLNMHTDFNMHPHQANWMRRINVLLFLNQNWEESYRGHLEFWDREMKNRVQKIAPIFNRCVIFTTDDRSYHGHPEPLACPDHMMRKSIALYYYTQQENTGARSTNYRPRPSDGFIKSVFIYLDKKILSGFDKIRRRFGIQDQSVTNILRFLAKFWVKK